MKVFSVVALVAAAVLAVVLLAFLVDYLTLRSSVEAPLRLTFAVATTKAVIQTLLVIPAAVGLGMGGMRSLGASGGKAGRHRQGGLVVGQPS